VGEGQTNNEAPRGATMHLGGDGQTLVRITRLEVTLDAVREDIREVKDDIGDLRSELLEELRAGRVARTETIKLFLEPKVFVPILALVGLMTAAATGIGISWGDLEVRGAEAATPVHLEHHEDTQLDKRKERKKDGKHSRRNNS
tara:strand:- start:1094 stop:1525 length:432 start_codon:yes stop_codon:yes gene_type:complete